MIPQNGLAQATGFLLAKGKEEHLALLDDIAQVLRETGEDACQGAAALHRAVIGADMATTMRPAGRWKHQAGSSATCKACWKSTPRAQAGKRRKKRKRYDFPRSQRKRYDFPRSQRFASPDQRGWSDVKTDSENADAGGKSAHIERICNLTVPKIYQQAYLRGVAATQREERFCCFEMKIENRLLIGLSGGGALETGCAVSHTYGMPYLPGSTVKGAALAWLQALPHTGADIVREIFGCEADERDLSGLSGIVGFHDAWWAPESRHV